MTTKCVFEFHLPAIFKINAEVKYTVFFFCRNMAHGKNRWHRFYHNIRTLIHMFVFILYTHIHRWRLRADIFPVSFFNLYFICTTIWLLRFRNNSKEKNTSTQWYRRKKGLLLFAVSLLFVHWRRCNNTQYLCYVRSTRMTTELGLQLPHTTL